MNIEQYIYAANFSCHTLTDLVHCSLFHLHCGFSRIFLWRRWESNPRPKTFPKDFLRVQDIIYLSPLPPPMSKLQYQLSPIGPLKVGESLKQFPDLNDAPV